MTIKDTARINTLFRKAQALHYNYPDSSLYYYQMIIDHNAMALADTPLRLSGIETEYLKTMIRSLNYSGNIYYYNDEYTRSEYYYKKSLGLAQAAGMRDFIARALFDLGYVKYVSNDFQKAKDLFEASYNNYARLEDMKGMFDAVHACGLAHRRLGNFTEADTCFKQALQKAVMIGDSMMVSDVRLNFGILLCEQGNLEEGIGLFEEALEYYESQGNDKAISLALLNVGVVMKMVKEYGKAMDYIQRSTRMEEALQQKSQLAVRYYNLADLFLEMEEPDKAYEYCQKLLAVASEIGSRPYVTECNFLLGKYHYLQKDYFRAERYFSLAADSVSISNNKPLKTNIQVWLARAAVENEDYMSALAHGIQAYNLAHEMHSLPWQKDASKILSEVYEKTGRLKEALAWHKTFLDHSDSISYFNLQKEINRIEARYNYEKKEKENELLRNKASLQEQQLRNRTIMTIALFIIISFSILLILLLIRRNRDAKLLYEQQQMLNLQHLGEIEKELDGKKRELASKMMFLNQKNELINRIIKRLQEIQDSSANSTDELNDIVSELRVESPQSNWREFELQFNQVHPDFYKRLYEKHPDLTSYEQRICAFLRMNLNSKEISSITGRSLKSIEVMRSRIRKKLGLSRKDNLNSYLASV